VKIWLKGLCDSTLVFKLWPIFPGFGIKLKMWLMFGLCLLIRILGFNFYKIDSFKWNLNGGFWLVGVPYIDIFMVIFLVLILSMPYRNMLVVSYGWIPNLSTWVKSLTWMMINRRNWRTTFTWAKKVKGKIFWLKLWVRWFGWLLGTHQVVMRCLLTYETVFFMILYYNFDQLIIFYDHIL
jgi:hypothetical protein